MELIREPRLRALVEAANATGGGGGHRTPVPHPPTDSDERAAWFVEVAALRRASHDWVRELIGARGSAGASASGSAVPGVDVQTVRIPVEGTCGDADCEPCSSGSILALVYRPSSSNGPLPVYVNFHGGAFWIMGGEEQLRTQSAGFAGLAASAGVVVIDVDYRLAPEHKFPVPPEDCYTALRWVVEQADHLGIDTDRIGIGGGSAGGALTAAVALMARDRQGPALRTQVLQIPVIDSGCNTPSMHLFAKGYVMSRAAALAMWDMYLSSPADAFDPYASPAHATDLENLPEALVIAGEYDTLRDEGLHYAQRLAGAGVTVTTKVFSQCHGAVLPDTAAEAQRLLVRHLRSVLVEARESAPKVSHAG